MDSWDDGWDDELSVERYSQTPNSLFMYNNIREIPHLTSRDKMNCMLSNERKENDTNDSSSIVKNREGKSMCLICNCEVSQNTKNIKTHLAGSQHIKKVRASSKVKKENGVDKIKWCVPKIQSGNSLKLLSDSKEMPVTPDQEIKDRYCVVETSYDKLMCLVCNCEVPLGDYNITIHILGRKHNRYLITPKAKEVTGADSGNSLQLLSGRKNIAVTLPQEIKDTSCIVEINDGTLMCLVCNCEVPLGEHNITIHVLGEKHNQYLLTPKVRKVKKGTVAVLGNRMEMLQVLKEMPASLHNEMKFIKYVSGNKFNCSVCNTEIQIHKNCLLEHINGSFHMRSVKAYNIMHVQSSTNESEKLQSILRNLPYEEKDTKCIVQKDQNNAMCLICDCDIPLDATSIEVHFLEQNHTQTSGINQSENGLELLPIFKQLPVSLHKEKKFITYVSDDKLKCSLCKINVSNHINALMDHLRGVRHINNNCDIPMDAKSIEIHLLGKIHTQTSEINQSENGLDLLPIFKQLPVSLLKEKKFITYVSGKKLLKCSLCKKNISNHINSLKEHLKGSRHNKNSKINGQNDVKSGNGLDMTQILNQLPVSLQNEMKFITYVSDKNLNCSVCKINVPNHINCLTEHLKEPRHNKNQYKLLNNTEKLENILRNLPQTIKDTKCIVENGQNIVTCLFCKLNIPLDAKSIETHLLGRNHSRKIKRIPQIETNEQIVELTSASLHMDMKFLKSLSANNICCLVCNRVMQNNKSSLQNHIKGSRHIKSEKVFNIINLDSSLNKSEILETIYSSPVENIKDTKCVIENSQGTVMCMICNCEIPPGSYNINIHLSGNKHKTKFEILSQLREVDGQSEIE